MLLMVEKGIRGGICHAFHWYAKGNNKYINDYDKNKESSYLEYSWIILRKIFWSWWIMQFSEMEMRKSQIIMSNPVYLGLSILDLSKTLMYKFWYDYVKPKYGRNVKLSYMDIENFIVHVKTDDIYKDIAEDVETRFDTLNFEINRSLTNGKNKKVIELIKDELGGQIMKGLVG